MSIDTMSFFKSFIKIISKIKKVFHKKPHPQPIIETKLEETYKNEETDEEFNEKILLKTQLIEFIFNCYKEYNDDKIYVLSEYTDNNVSNNDNDNTIFNKLIGED